MASPTPYSGEDAFITASPTRYSGEDAFVVASPTRYSGEDALTVESNTADVVLDSCKKDYLTRFLASVEW